MSIIAQLAARQREYDAKHAEPCNFLLMPDELAGAFRAEASMFGEWHWSFGDPRSLRERHADGDITFNGLPIYLGKHYGAGRQEEP